MSERSWWESVPAAVAVAGLITVGVLGSAPHIPAGPGHREIDALAVGLGLVGAWALLLRWVQPYLMVAISGLAVATYAYLNYPGGPEYLPGPLAVMTFGFVRSRRQLYAVAVAYLAAMSVATLAAGDGSDYSAFLGFLGWTGAAVLVAEVLRARRERAAAHRETQRRQQQQTLVEQQLGLARDLHDSVAHALTAINVQAAIAERTVHRDPEAAAGAAAAIRETSRSALTDLTQIVKSLRSTDDTPTSPDRGLEDVETLVEQARRGGLQVELQRLGGEGRDRPGGDSSDREVGVPAALAAYRLVQEALTNATRYAPGSRVQVVIDRRQGLTVIVRDDGGDPHRADERVQGSGHGLLGMRERVLASGGTLEHGPRERTGFEVAGRWANP
ncbi:sensor histidine kinase [Luteipulveratus flavus]|uniref:histidine kinase n=1 Tax=Luteipulveratus flavus TaxID=3031728 RepID=A0ABT6C4W8_9MICO|nr:histidine kinase [Luteipulveratus sp. YIM 133296]MDF8263751.1 histidine kinase [Luteipulveratus sp. YIM 133296]